MDIDCCAIFHSEVPAVDGFELQEISLMGVGCGCFSNVVLKRACRKGRAEASPGLKRDQSICILKVVVWKRVDCLQSRGGRA